MWKWILGYSNNLMEGVHPKFNKYSYFLFLVVMSQF
jgi:hypothetical protein